MTGALSTLRDLRDGFKSQKSSFEWKTNRMKASRMRHCRTVMTYSFSEVGGRRKHLWSIL